MGLLEKLDELDARDFRAVEEMLQFAIHSDLFPTVTEERACRFAVKARELFNEHPLQQVHLRLLDEQYPRPALHTHLQP